MLRHINPSPFRPPKEVNKEYKTFRGGLNTLFKQTELRDNELAQADNLILTGSGVPTKRWGSQDYFMANVTGYGRGLLSVKSTAGTTETLSLTDWGILAKQSGASYTNILGVSWASGYNLEGVELNNNIYLVNGQRELARYNFSTLVGFTTLAIPAGVAVTNFSGATGLSTYSWRVAATSQVGETLGSTAISMASLPQLLSQTLMRVSWTPVSAASGILTGYNVYRGAPGDEVWIGSVDDQTNRFDDIGSTTASFLRQPATADTTGGPIAKFIIRYQDRMVLAGLPNDPTKVLISGRVSNEGRFDWAGGGGYVKVDPDTGDDITGLAVHQGRIIVMKRSSVWEVKITLTTVGTSSIIEPTYQLTTASQGCTSHRSIAAVDNDLLFLNNKGVYVLGYEPNIVGDVLRTNELSAKVRPFFETLSSSDLTNATAVYFDYKYVIAFPSAKKCIVFDKEKVAWMGPWTTTFGINKLIKHIDSAGVERCLAIDADDNFVTELSKTLVDDKGTAFSTTLRTRKDDFGDWTLFKTINEEFMAFKNVTGTVNVNIYTEDRTGTTSVVKSFSVTGSAQTVTAGWGTDQWGNTQFGISQNSTSSSSEDIIKRALLYKTARLIQTEILTTGRSDNYELLSLKMKATPQGSGNIPQVWDAG